MRWKVTGRPMSAEKVSSKFSARPSPDIRSSVKELLGKQIDALARRFAASQDTRVGEIERMAMEYGKLGEPWVFPCHL